MKDWILDLLEFMLEITMIILGFTVAVTVIGGAIGVGVLAAMAAFGYRW